MSYHVFNVSLHDSDTDEGISSPPLGNKNLVMCEAEKRRERNIQERKALWEQKREEYENM